jgi:hypothetical protein
MQLYEIKRQCQHVVWVAKIAGVAKCNGIANRDFIWVGVPW